ncbi:MAG: response regulator [Proteobacteria bacterium]|nr:response regulator [Pseudomonadota bacterium]
MAALVLPLCVLAAEGWVTWRATWDKARSELLRSADAGAEYAARTLYGYQMAAGRINDLLRGLSDATILAREPELHREMRRIVQELPRAEAAYVVDRKGFPLLSANIFPVPKDKATAADRDFFHALSQPNARDPHISQIYVGRFDQKLFFALTRRREGTGNQVLPGEFDGVVNLSIQPEMLGQGLRAFLARSSDDAFLVRDDRQVLARTGDIAQLQPLMQAKAPFSHSALIDLEENSSSLDGVPQLVARRWAGDFPVYVAVRRPVAAIVGEWLHTMRTYLGFGLPATLALVFLALRVRSSQQRLAQSNRQLAEALAGTEDRLHRAQTAGGVFPFEIAPTGIVSGPAEFRALFGAPMRGELRRADLEARIVGTGGTWLDAGGTDSSQGGRSFSFEVQVATPDDTPRWLLVAGQARPGPDGLQPWVSGVAMDVTARKEAELALQQLNHDLEARVRNEIAARESAQARLSQAQRLEALGQLAAGVAHDFNNVLQAVSGGLSLIQSRATDTESVRRFARMADAAAQRGASITARLLSFARQGELKAEPIAMPQLLQNLKEILATTLGPTVTVEIDCPSDTVALADPSQLDTVLVNLAVNARDAMPQGGRLTLSAAPEAVADDRPLPVELKAGRYVRLSVADTGLGMDETVLRRASEPFFTTKPVGQGTGLGLAMARGFVQQSGGALAIDSKVGQGTVVTLWLPQAEAATCAHTGTTVLAPGSVLDMELLVVDDDDLVLQAVAGNLAQAGYRVTTASDGLAALAKLDDGAVPALLVTDYAMPGMNGTRLINEARRKIPDLPAVLITGYADRDAETLQAGIGGRVEVLRKPVQTDSLITCITRLTTGSQGDSMERSRQEAGHSMVHAPLT